jgi:DDE family transposase
VPTECSATLFEFAPVEGRRVVAGFDGGAITSDAGALLLGEADRAIGLTARLAACFTDARAPELTEHAVDTMVLQRVSGIALGYEGLNDHDELRHDPVLAVLAGKLSAKRSDCAPLAGKSTLNRLELSRQQNERIMKEILGRVAVRIPTWPGGHIGAEHMVWRLQKVVASRLQRLRILTHRIRISASIVKWHQRTE